MDLYPKETIADEEEQRTGSVQDLPSDSGIVRKLTTSFEHLRGMSLTHEAKQNATSRELPMSLDASCPC